MLKRAGVIIPLSHRRFIYPYPSLSHPTSTAEGGRFGGRLLLCKKRENFAESG